MLNALFRRKKKKKSVYSKYVSALNKRETFEKL